MEFPEFTISIKGISKPDNFPIDRFMGEDVAKWIRSKLTDFETFDCEEDWGWYLSINNNGYCVIVGIYDYLNDVNGKSVWGIRTFDSFSFRGLLNRKIERIRKTEIVSRIVFVLNNDADVDYKDDKIE